MESSMRGASTKGLLQAGFYKGALLEGFYEEASTSGLL